MINELPPAEKVTYRNEGDAAFADGMTHSACPYSDSKEEGHKRAEWLHGWWRSYYQQVDRDEAVLTIWIDEQVLGVHTEAQAKVIAHLIVHQNYDRTLPIPGNKIGELTFDLPPIVSMYRSHQK